MLNEINICLGSLAEATKAEISYELSMNVDFRKFYLLKHQKELLEQEKLNFNLYKLYR
jgi:hypothetical protein